MENQPVLSVQEKRGAEGMRRVGFFPEYRGILVSDCLGAYWKFGNLSHAICNAHIPVRQPGQRGKLSKGKVRCLIDRLTARWEEALLFLEDFRVPFTNNRAEQSLRMAKVKGEVSGFMRTVSGADNFAVIMSFIGSVKKRGINVLSAVEEAFLGNAYGVLFPE